MDSFRQHLAESANTLSALIRTFSDIDIHIRERNGIIRLDKIVIPKDQRGEGRGSEFMNALTQYADRTKQRIATSPSKDFGATSVSRLEQFYKKAGFKKNSGRNKDWEITETMIREPKT